MFINNNSSLNRFVLTYQLAIVIYNQMNVVLSMLQSIVYKVHSLSTDLNRKGWLLKKIPSKKFSGKSSVAFGKPMRDIKHQLTRPFAIASNNTRIGWNGIW